MPTFVRFVLWVGRRKSWFLIAHGLVFAAPERGVGCQGTPSPHDDSARNRFATVGTGRVAYQLLGDGPREWCLKSGSTRRASLRSARG